MINQFMNLTLNILDVDNKTFSGNYQLSQYGGKELDRENGLERLNFGGLGWYDNHARWYDPVSMRFTTPDPLAEKYFHITPFANCANNPVNLIDVNGDSIAVLGYSKGEHIALLIQHEDRKWHYYSFNGTGIYLLTSGSLGGLPMHNLGEKPFDSVSDFLQREYNREGKDYERMNGTANGYGYDKALAFPTDEKQDNLVRETFLKVVAQGYNPLTNNCATAVSAAVQSIGIDTSIFVRGVFVPGFSIPLKLNALLPSSVYKAIKENTHNLKK